VTLKIGQIAPDFEQDTSNGSLRFHEWIQGAWSVLFSFPSDQAAKSSPLALASLADGALRRAQWKRRNVKLIGLSRRTSDAQARRQEELSRTHGVVLDFPVIADADGTVTKLYHIDDADMDSAPSREKCHVFVTDPSKRVRLVRTYPAAMGCDFVSLQVAIDEMQRAEQRSSGGASVGDDTASAGASDAGSGARYA
jgi:alkyl hydroperoxide reductase subunit AhpC